MSLTCICCKLLFSIPELHHEHYKSDWHRYNLKRRIAELPPLNKDEFEERAAVFQASSKEKEKISLKCITCNKNFSSKNAMANHLKSKKHLDLEISGRSPVKPKSKPKTYTGDVKLLQQPKTGEKNVDMVDEVGSDGEWSDADDGDWESCDEEEDGGIERIVVDTDDCLFCDHQSDSTENNVTHMTEAHSFFIPDVEYVSDLDGLVAFLAGKIQVAHVCLWCDGKGKGFRSIKSVKQHMLDKGHCKMLHEGEALVDYADFYDYSSCDVQEDHFDEDAITDLLEDSAYELVLPSGATIGHRSLSLYYKQNLKPVSSDAKKKVKGILQHYKSLGYTGATGLAAVKKARDIAFMQKIKNRYNLKLALKNNKNQPHLRRQIMC